MIIPFATICQKKKRVWVPDACSLSFFCPFLQYCFLAFPVQYHESMIDNNATKLHLIRCTLSALVPIAIFDLQQMGGPTEYHLEEAQKFGFVLGEKGDSLLYYVKGQTGKMMGRFCEAVAILAFCPGGVTVFGLHFEATVRQEE